VGGKIDSRLACFAVFFKFLPRFDECWHTTRHQARKAPIGANLYQENAASFAKNLKAEWLLRVCFLCRHAELGPGCKKPGLENVSC